MASLQDEITRQIGNAFALSLIDKVFELLKTKPYDGEFRLAHEGSNHVIYGSAEFAQREEGMFQNMTQGEISKQKITHVYSRRIGKQIRTIQRTYVGMRPKKVWKKLAGSGTPWRVVPLYPVPPQGAVDESWVRALAYVLDRDNAQRILPTTIDITSFD